MKKHLGLMRAVGSICAAVLLLSALAVGVDVCPIPDRPTERPKAPAFAPPKADPQEYTGRVRLYMVEPTSRWKDYNNNAYHFGFLDFPLDSAVALTDGSRYYLPRIWDASEAGWWSAKKENLRVIGMLYNSEAYPANSDTGSGTAYPFDAHYVDAAAAAEDGQVDSNHTTGTSTHTVFVQVGTATWCPSCPATNYWLNETYKLGTYNFYFAEMVVDVNPMADTFMDNQFNLAWLPTSYFDGGYRVLVGGYTGTSAYGTRISACEARTVPDVGLLIGFKWLGNNDDKYQIDLAIAHGAPVNTIPNNPPTPSGPDTALVDTTYSYNIVGSDPENDPLSYRWDWGDGDTSDWLGPYAAAVPCTLSHAWADTGFYDVRVQSRDPWHEGGWSDPLTVTICCIQRGDFNRDGAINVADLTATVDYLFFQGASPPCEEEGDFNGDGAINVADLTATVDYLFFQGASPAACW